MRSPGPRIYSLLNLSQFIQAIFLKRYTPISVWFIRKFTSNIQLFSKLRKVKQKQGANLSLIFHHFFLKISPFLIILMYYSPISNDTVIVYEQIQMYESQLFMNIHEILLVGLCQSRFRNSLTVLDGVLIIEGAILMECVRCRNKIDKPVALICDHWLCVGCARKVMKQEGRPPLDLKIRIVCPKCQKNTLSQCLQNLVKAQNDSFLFDNGDQSQVNESMFAQQPQHSKYSQKELRQMPYTQRFSNIWGDRKTPDINDRASRASNESKRSIKSQKQTKILPQNNFVSQCHVHKQQVMFFCGQEKKLMCLECMYKHTKEHKNHKVFPVGEAAETIKQENNLFKQQAMRKIEEIQKSICVCKGNMSKVQKAYEIHQEIIEKEFRQLQKLLQHKKQQVLEFLDKHFTKKQAEVTHEINDFKFSRNCYQEHFEYPLDSQQSNLYFYNAYTKLRSELGKNHLKIKNLNIEDLACFEKLNSTEEFQNLLDRLIRPKPESASRDGQDTISRGKQLEKTKNLVKEELKIAKKTLNKLNQQEKDHHREKKDKTADYLCNYALSIQKAGAYDKKTAVRERKSSIAAFMHNQDNRKHQQSSKTLTPTRHGSAKSKRH